MGLSDEKMDDHSEGEGRTGKSRGKIDSDSEEE